MVEESVAALPLLCRWPALVTVALLVGACASRSTGAGPSPTQKETSSEARASAPVDAGSRVDAELDDASLSVTEPPPRMTDPDHPDLRLHEWASAEGSTSGPVDLDFPRCLKDRGCPFEAATLPMCPPGIEALSVAEALRLAEKARLPFSERGVFVKGWFFAPKMMTLLECAPETCCNRASGHFRLADDVRSNSAESTLFFSRGKKPDAFACRGDDSRFCCGFASGEAIAFGRIRGQELVDPKLCRVR